MKPKDSFQNRLEKAIQIKNIKPVELHEKTGISESLISKYLSGNAVARQRKLTLLADALNINEIWLMGYDVAMERNIKTDKLGNPVVSIPILGVVKAGYDYLAQENWIGTVDIDKKLAESGEFFALQVHGDSMVPIFFEGDTVIIRKQNDCENNQVAVVIVNGDEGTLKKVKKLDDGGIKLIPFNRTLDATGEPLYEDKTFSREEIEKFPVTIAGVFQEMRRTKIKF